MSVWDILLGMVVIVVGITLMVMAARAVLRRPRYPWDP